MYQWIMRRKGFQVSDIGYFLYVDGLHVDYDGMIDLTDTAKAVMYFSTSILSYTGSDGWVDGALVAIKQLLLSDTMPNHSEECEFGVFLNQVSLINPN